MKTTPTPPVNFSNRLRFGILKTKPLAASFGIVLATLLADGSAQAADLNWQGAGSTTTTTDFNLNTNWQNGTLPGSTDIGFFSNTSGTLNSNVTANITIGGLAFGNGAHTVSSSGGFAITLTSSADSTNPRPAFYGFAAGQTETVSADLILAPTSGGVSYFYGNSPLSNFTFSGDISGAAKISFKNGGTFTFSGSNTFTGGMAIESSIVNLNIGSANALGTGALQMSSGLGSNNQTVSNTSGGALALNNGLTFARAQTSQNANFTGSDMTFTGAVKLLNANNATTTLTVSNKLTLSGVVAHTGYTNGGLTKAGTGTLVLKGANTYAGPITVSTGTLLVNNTTGSGTGTGAVSVTAGGTLGGTGTITPTGTNGITVASDAFLAPGASIGNLTANLGSTTGTLSLTSGAVFKFELGAANATIGTIAADSSDLLTIAGAGAGDVVFGGNNIDLLGTATGTGYYKLFDTSAGASTWTGLTLGASVDGGTLITGGLTTSNYGGGFSGDLILADGTFGTSAGDIYLNVVPEPSTFALLGAGVLALGWRARSRRQSAPGC